MARRAKLLIIFALLMLASTILPNYGRSQQILAQTIPSRTPTPPGGGVTATPDDGGSDPGATALPTSTASSPQATATATRILNLATPLGGFLPTAQPCSLEPTITSLGSSVNVRSGPGLDYKIVGQLKLYEVRPIIGRAAYINWWQIILVDGTLGWVADSVVETNGYIEIVPIVDPPEREDGHTPTPGTPWAPTPFPECTPPATPSRTATPASSTTPRPTSTAAGGPPALQPEIDNGPGAGELDEPATPTGLSTATAATGSGATPESPDGPTAEPLPGEGERSGGMSWIPIAAIGLMLAAAGVFALQRLRG